MAIVWSALPAGSTIQNEITTTGTWTTRVTPAGGATLVSTDANVHAGAMHAKERAGTDTVIMIGVDAGVLKGFQVTKTV